MKEISVVNISSNDFNNMKIIKYDSNTKETLIAFKNNILYKKSNYDVVEKYKLLLSSDLIQEYDNYVFIKDILNIDNEFFGYTTYYYKDYKPLSYYVKQKKLTYNQKIKIMKKIIYSIIDLHNYGIIHGDLHMKNILCNKNDIKIIDFDAMSDKSEIYKIKDEINYLNMIILSIIYDVNFLIINYESFEYPILIDELKLPKHLKEYIINCIYNCDMEIPLYLSDYIDELDKRYINECKKYIKLLKK